MSSVPWSIGGNERPRDRSKPLPSRYLDRLAGPCRCLAQPIPARNGGSQGGASSLLEEPRVPGSMKGPTLVQPGRACYGIGVQFPVEYACFQSDPAGDARPLRFPIQLAAPGSQAATEFSRFAVGNRPLCSDPNYTHIPRESQHRPGFRPAVLRIVTASAGNA